MAPPGPVGIARGRGNKAYGSKSEEGMMRAADDFDVIRARMAELQRDRDRVVPRGGDDLSRRTRSVDIDERLRSVDLDEDRTSQQQTRVRYGRG